MISLKKSIADNETEQALMRAIQLLLQGMGLHAVAGDPDDHAEFRREIDKTLQRVDEVTSTGDLVVQAKLALNALEIYNRRTLSYLRLPAMELQAMVKMLTSTVSTIAEAGGENVRRLRDIEQQVQFASLIEDVRQIKTKLGECLEGIRRESERQKAETNRTVDQLNQDLSRVQKEKLPKTDEATGLPSRSQAEEAIGKACQEGAQAYALAVQIDRIRIFNSRFGYEVGDELLRYLAGFLRKQLPEKDLLFRWSGPTLVALLFRPHDLERVRDEIGRIMDFKHEHTVQTASRTVLLPISARWAIFPMMAPLAHLLQKVDSFAG